MNDSRGPAKEMMYILLFDNSVVIAMTCKRILNDIENVHNVLSLNICSLNPIKPLILSVIYEKCSRKRNTLNGTLGIYNQWSLGCEKLYETNFFNKYTTRVKEREMGRRNLETRRDVRDTSTWCKVWTLFGLVFILSVIMVVWLCFKRNPCLLEIYTKIFADEMRRALHKIIGTLRSYFYKKYRI